ncbi:glycosyltransferase family protein [Halobacterium salinarum]|uniref:glycosyltransferase family protein n=1 Tax=Halobacterium salinarum TaxID=2242 RepID=UPI0025574018|nr:glycosyltransferase family protein [Halobacterium salinarum]MDL0131503.1 glycosyltransferase family protein [Halobacterium salinarum]
MSEHTVAVIQARMGSTRLPGKVLLPLDCDHVLSHDIRRVSAAETVDSVVVATSTETADDAIEQFGSIRGIDTHRGSEKNVQQRLYEVASAHDADTILRITADCPLIDPKTIDTVVSRVNEGRAEYASNTTHRTFPRGLDVEAFTYESFENVVSAATTQAEREHVTPYYRNNPEEFELVNVTSDEVFDEEQYIDRTDLRLTLDEAADYRLLKRIYDELKYSGTIPIQKAIDHVDDEGLSELNEAVRQKET